MQPLQPGEFVLVRRKAKKKGKTRKFTGPFQVVKQVKSGDNICETTYLVEDPPWKKNSEEVPAI
jgi:hypothetical protein